jgi:hypothetical protein
MKLGIILLLLVCLAGTAFSFSQYYIPSNYIETTGQIGTSYNEGGNSAGQNYIVLFTSKTGQHISYKYQTLIPDIHIGPSLNVYYNPSNPQQVKINPSHLEILAELGLVDFGVPFIAVLSYSRRAQLAQKKNGPASF